MYELLISKEPKFAESVISRTGEQALPANAWLSDTRLEYGTTYFWKVRARTADNYSAWSEVSAFTTEAIFIPATTTMPQTQPATSSPQPIGLATTAPQQLPPSITNVEFTIPTWAIFGGLGLLVVIVLILVIMLVVVKRR